MMRIARLIAAKDLRVEWRSRVLLNQVLPFAMIVLVLFAFALDNGGVVSDGTTNPPTSRSITEYVAPGLLWLATMFSLLIVVQRAFAIEAGDGALDALRVAGVDPAGIFLGKALAIAIQLLVLEVVTALGVIVFYDAEVRLGGVVLLVTTLVTATCGLAAVGTLYGGLTAGAKGRETLLPLLLLPVVAPVLIGATKASEAAWGTGGTGLTEGWPWVGLLAVFAAVFIAVGTVAFGPLLDE
jgi:heme exporter protein B